MRNNTSYLRNIFLIYTFVYEEYIMISAICDKNIERCSYVHDMLNDYMNDNNIDTKIYSFLDSNIFMNEIEDGKKFDFLIADEDTIDHRQCCKCFKNNTKMTVIYIMSCPKTDKHHNFYYIEKRNDNTWFEVDRILGETLKKDIYNNGLGCYCLKSGNILCRLPFSDIMYIEHVDSKNIIHMNNNSVFVERKTMAKMSDQINKRVFVKCHRAFAVNMMYVRQLINSSFIMINGDVIPISRNELSNVKERFIQFYYTNPDKMDNLTQDMMLNYR